MRRGGLDLATVLAQLRRYPGEAECLVDPFLGLARHAHVVVDAEKAVLVQLQTALDGAVTQDDVVGFRAGEILHCRAAAFARDQPQIRLITTLEANAGLRVAVTEYA